MTQVPSPVERFFEAHPGGAAGWYPGLARTVGTMLAVPGLNRALPLARRVHAVAQPAGRVTVAAQPCISAASHRRHLTVLSANLWCDWPRQRRWPQRLEAVARLAEAEDVDLLFLQEVAHTPVLAAGVWLSERLGMALAYARANGDVDAIGFEEGPAILSRHPLREIHLAQLSHGHNPLVRRVALGAEVQTPHGTVLAVSAHLGLAPRQNARQIRGLRGWVADISGGRAAVVGGDFNAAEGRAEIARTQRTWTDTFRAAHPYGHAATHASVAPWGRWRPPRRLDYIFVQQPRVTQWRVGDARHVDAPGGPHSDHRAVLARLLPGQPPVDVASTPAASAGPVGGATHPPSR
jgi:endonuclease/exonuclease/phosphatase family metal-dependent hydrolase